MVAFPEKGLVLSFFWGVDRYINKADNKFRISITEHSEGFKLRFRSVGSQALLKTEQRAG
ncbi:hypothetical protein A3J19_00025 [Candidatus Daviesbacteria bacterium RIFCSPLOWO2_02_FULL_41_8]|uniref:Uncharacterized protein n=3 Tax=Candidatus Daviesiibacteriota TaxID=1752718 RepID=A0A1F5NMA1_9BACT|nr:MAG: hypothetical protein A2871_02985 [Candidatus Daviesbacteria bacterium RIFCSPHIGHO2_01_FULL_41_23]OGE33645.1 MAG: hypothetical protein A3D83_00630 [Candidatus Daviesbacteria bacterium RIFCSPHIGHO2_02_FULL_41_10]OGE61898.1 MAG: hypothetical protein A2967_02800 [Candidatus Daviesbacteria bacterium RIFCSPLOWO2_01_FULL_41_32]OGE78644.1 MAG: hypothetical protein A3J19_00025 [Candidatus Daviesbacteria bacterium RIFCSPLOWO2_02_FULL_41_8]